MTWSIESRRQRQQAGQVGSARGSSGSLLARSPELKLLAASIPPSTTRSFGHGTMAELSELSKASTALQTNAQQPWVPGLLPNARLFNEPTLGSGTDPKSLVDRQVLEQCTTPVSIRPESVLTPGPPARKGSKVPSSVFHTYAACRVFVVGEPRRDWNSGPEHVLIKLTAGTERTLRNLYLEAEGRTIVQIGHRYFYKTADCKHVWLIYMLETYQGSTSEPPACAQAWITLQFPKSALPDVELKLPVANGAGLIRAVRDVYRNAEKTALTIAPEGLKDATPSLRLVAILIDLCVLYRLQPSLSSPSKASASYTRLPNVDWSSFALGDGQAAVGDLFKKYGKALVKEDWHLRSQLTDGTWPRERQYHFVGADSVVVHDAKKNLLHRMCTVQGLANCPIPEGEKSDLLPKIHDSGRKNIFTKALGSLKYFWIETQTSTCYFELMAPKSYAFKFSVDSRMQGLSNKLKESLWEEWFAWRTGLRKQLRQVFVLKLATGEISFYVEPSAPARIILKENKYPQAV